MKTKKNKAMEPVEKALNFFVMGESEGLTWDVEKREIYLFSGVGEYEASPAQMLDALNAMPRGEKVTLLIDSPGGEVFAGLSMANLIRARGNVHVRVIGLAASIASVIAVSGVRNDIEDNALMMIHDPLTIAMGNANDFLQIVDELEKIKGAILTTYERRTTLERNVIAKMMTDETWLDATESVSSGFADAVFEPIAENRVDKVYDLKKYGASKIPDVYVAKVKKHRIMQSNMDLTKRVMALKSKVLV